MSLTVLVVVVGLWLVWLGALLVVLHGLGTAPAAAERRGRGVRAR